jgi:hypothetical protein
LTERFDREKGGQLVRMLADKGQTVLTHESALAIDIFLTARIRIFPLDLRPTGARHNQKI